MTQKIFRHKGIDLSYVDRGTGVPIVLLHGFPLDHRMWQPQIDTLSDSFRVVSPDLRGFGKSTLAELDVAEGIEMQRYAADVIALLDHLQIDQPAILCGFSMGGYVLWQLALKYSDHIRAIVPCDTRAVADSAETRQARLKMAEDVLLSGTGLVAEAMLPKLLAPQTLAQQPDISQQVDAMMRAAAPEAVAAALRGMACREDVRGKLASLKMPALLLVGSEDVISPPAEMREIASAMPNAKLIEIAGAGHMTTLENPDAVSSAIRSFAASID